MIDSPQPDNSDRGRPTSVANVSDGVHVDAREVSIDGDVVGGDKITQNTWIRQFIMSPWAWIGGAVIVVIGLIIAASILNIGPLQTLFPKPTPTAFALASDGQSLIIVADFEDRSGGKYQGIDPAQYIYEQLITQARKDNLDVRIERLRHTVDDNTVRSTGERYNATLVLWGWYDALTITPRIERIKSRTDYQSTEEGKHLSLADPARVESSIVTDLPSQSAYLVFLTLGLDAYSNPARNLAAALTYFNSAIEALPTSARAATTPAEVYFFRADTYLSQGDNDHAIADYDKAIQLKPDNAKSYNNRGAAYDRKGDHDHAIADYDQAIQLNSDNPEAYYNRGIAYDEKGNYDRAIADYDQAIQLKPGDAKFYENRGVVYDETGDYDRAIADYNKAIQITPDDADIYYNRGSTYANKHDYDRAIVDYNTAIQLDPEDAKVYNNRGIAYLNKGDIDRAITDFDQAIRLRPDSPLSYCGRGIAYTHKGEKEEAIASYTKCRDMSDDPQFRKSVQDALNALGAQ